MSPTHASDRVILMSGMVVCRILMAVADLIGAYSWAAWARTKKRAGERSRQTQCSPAATNYRAHGLRAHEHVVFHHNAGRMKG